MPRSTGVSSNITLNFSPTRLDYLQTLLPTPYLSQLWNTTHLLYWRKAGSGRRAFNYKIITFCVEFHFVRLYVTVFQPIQKQSRDKVTSQQKQ